MALGLSSALIVRYLNRHEAPPVVFLSF